LIIPIDALSCDLRAMNGAWCTLPYPDHPDGCPNFNTRETCPPVTQSIQDIIDRPYYLVGIKFDLASHANRLKMKHPHWSERQARCVLYYQARLNKQLWAKAEVFTRQLGSDFIFVKKPEAHGVDMFTLCQKYRIHLACDYLHQKYIYKFVIVGKQKN
jgi:hypothetical protein